MSKYAETVKKIKFLLSFFQREKAVVMQGEVMLGGCGGGGLLLFEFISYRLTTLCLSN